MNKKKCNHQNAKFGNKGAMKNKFYCPDCMAVVPFKKDIEAEEKLKELKERIAMMEAENEVKKAKSAKDGQGTKDAKWPKGKGQGQGKEKGGV